MAVLRSMARKITALKAQKRNPQRVNVYLDGEFAFGLARIVAAWLHVGQELSEAKIAELLRADAAEQAYQKAWRYLSYRPRSEAEVRTYLARRGVEPALIESVLARLRDLGLVDDEAFARAWVENRGTFRPRGRRALQAELRQKGISPDLVERALAEVDEEQLALQAGLKALRRYARLEWPAFRQKMGAYLARRGFDYETIRAILPQLWERRPSSPDELSEKGARR
ncbi:MAG TPA: hypothetical protein G4O04_00560 [Anaerolineae bacterium]|nr:hypothetical protein [Anaerolineae bacterium]HID85237.1 hypothetical protein [Anaerolineales bacterium]HIQ09079.1 hypothetical protein [Anaerolineaceae bacterium]